MELTWLADTPQSRRRTRALRACSTCQRKKKRCRHLGRQTLATGISDGSRNSQRERSSSHAPRNSPGPDEPTGLSDSLSSPPGASRIERFVGDLNPEAAIREKLDAPDGPHLRDRVGLWVNASVQQSQERRGDRNHSIAGIQAEHSLHHDSETLSFPSILRRRYSSSLRACERLPRSTLSQLAAIYLSKVNTILPLVDHVTFLTDSSKGTASVFLEQAVCLVAAKDAAAGHHLRLTAEGGLVTARKFCSELYNGLTCAMEANLEQDRVTRIRILALMSLHSEEYEGAEAASMHLCQAIHQAQTVGLHLERPDRSPGDQLTTLFWCLWTLDKMHASIGGRPLLLADRDIGIRRPDVNAHRAKSAFDVWFALSEMLSTVISFYRPSADDTTGWRTDYPSFEEIMGENVREDMDFATLSVLEIYYHAISILSCRYRPSQRSGGVEPSFTRQGLAAVRINSLVSSECAQGLPPLPIVPYAVSLSMGVSYQQFRSSKLITHFDRAKASLEACCVMLQALGVYWYSAEAMARLGRKALREIDGTIAANSQPNRGSQPSTIMNRGSESLNSKIPGITNAEMSVDGIPTAPYTIAAHQSSEHTQDGMIGEQPAMPLVDEQQDGGQDLTDGDGFADIDMLFDDFLDLSLPTNFWDPVFFPTTAGNDV
ncbi:transcription factor domain-containing protein [Aspergillus undulatus]|uniref:transcription factor domain-containing protein n=1 Tax=Aspergillus undulatus TaxID=1810928 RepID=UPI003CCC9A50